VKVRKFSDRGLNEFQLFLDSLSTDSPRAYPYSILVNENTTNSLPVEIEIETRNFANRFEAAEYLYGLLSKAGLPGLEMDRGLWAWLALIYFEQLCPADDLGQRKPGVRSRWIPETEDYRRYYRHLLAGPYLIYQAHRDDPARAMVLLCNPLSSPGDIVEQFASRQEIVTSKAIIGAATQLYIDQTTKLPKRGAAGKTNGGARRFAEILNQFDVTWDFSVMEPADLLAMLPNEFDRFRSKKNK
jgi:hypothetical protein